MVVVLHIRFKVDWEVIINKLLPALKDCPDSSKFGMST